MPMRILPAITLMLILVLSQGVIAGQDLSDALESENARLYKESIIGLMVQVGRMSILQ